jgi:hypothetical protein
MVVGVCIISICVMGLFQVKYKVKNLKRDLLETHRQLVLEKENIHVLKAEWTYLTQPVRIERLTEKYLGLKPIRVSQMQYDVLVNPKKQIAKNVNPTRITPTLRPILSSAKGGI